MITGLLLLYLLRDLFFRLIIFVLGFIGILTALVLIVVGLGLIFWRRKVTWYRIGGSMRNDR